MLLDSECIGDLRDLAAGDDFSKVGTLSISQVTIGAVVELACMRAALHERSRSIIDGWATSFPALDLAFRTLDHGVLPHTASMWSPRSVDFFPLRGSGWSEARNYHPFEARFRSAAIEAGFGARADGLAGFLFEMADNVAQHSGSSSSQPSPGLIGYCVHPGHVAFAVGDLGRGVLASLKENPLWTDLQNSKEALVAVLEKHASRRPSLGDGEGFKQVFRSLADLNGLVTLASGDGRLRLRHSADGRKAIPEFSSAFPGLQLSVNCSLSGEPREIPISY